MKHVNRLCVIGTALIFSVSLARAQEMPDPSVLAGKIANWPAPAYWSPERSVDSSGELSGIGIEASTSPMPFIGVTPCRLLDTRPPANNPLDDDGIYGVDEIRTYTLPGACSLPGTIQAVSLNITATNTGSGAFGHIKIWPADQVEPNVSTLNYPGAGETIANAAVVPLSAAGALKVKSGNASADVILDVNGYYAPAGVGSYNTFLGSNAGNFTMTGDFNTGIGSDALRNNTAGSDNTANGAGSLSNNTGCCNTATGSAALLSNVTGELNTAIGSGALAFNISGFRNIGIGFQAGLNLTESNNICIGNTGVAGESSTIRIGTVGTHTVTFIAGINGVAVMGAPVLVSSSGQLGVASSSRLVKEDIRNIAEESDDLMKLRPVAFRYRPQIDPTRLTQYGLIAEEVADVYPDLVVYDRDGRPETVRYQLVNALLLNELQKQHRTAEAQERTIEQHEAEIEVLKARLSRLEARP